MRRIMAMALFLGLAWFAHASSASENILEYQVKAAYLYNFLKFIEWPAQDQRPQNEPWVLGVLGQSVFSSVLEEAVRTRTLEGRSVVVKRVSSPRDVQGCHILFVPRGEFSRSNIPAQPGLLTVGESPGFLDAGGLVNFYIEEKKVHFTINVDQARAAGLHISAQLLKLAGAQ